MDSVEERLVRLEEYLPKLQEAINQKIGELEKSIAKSNEITNKNFEWFRLTIWKIT